MVGIKEISRTESKGYDQSQLVLEISGDGANTPLVNTLRRACLYYVPTYAFIPESITIEKSNSIYHDDYMKLRISQMMLPDLKIPIEYLEDEYWYNVDYRDPDRAKHPKDKVLYEMYVNAENKSTQGILNVTTNDCKFFADGEQIERYDKKYPHLIIQLQPDQYFSCHAVGVLGNGKRNSIWSAASNVYLKEISENKFHLIIESKGQMSEYEILKKACTSVIERYRSLEKKLKEIEGTDEMSQIDLRLEGEDHTVGLLINHFLQEDKNVVFSGLIKEDQLVDEIMIKIKTVKPGVMKQVFNAIDQSVQAIEKFKKTLK